MKGLLLTTIVSLFALTGCGAAYYESEGVVSAESVASSNAATMPEPTPTATTNGEIAVGAQEDIYEDTDPTALTEFRTTLDPYGTWYEDESYGTVWVPSATVVGADFAPYVSAGHWTYDDDYVWVSDYDWGWAPFHYGRWVWIAGRGWSWIPGRRYAGAWVSWRVGYDGYGYVGWAPMPPSWYWRGGYAYGLGWYPSAPYVFCEHRYLFGPSVSVNIVTGARVQEIGAHTRPYVPAQPSVGANGSTNGRTIASPNVHGVGGPPPGQLGIMSAPRPEGTNAGLLRAQQYARPSSAVPVGARAPMIGHAAPDSLGRVSTIGGSPAVAPAVPHYVNPSQPSVRGPVPSYSQSFGRPAQIPSQQAQPAYRPAPSPQPYAAPHYSPQYSAPQYSAPQYSAPAPSAPHYAPQPSFQQPHYSAPQPAPHFSQATPTSPPAHYSAPAPAPHFSSPSFSSPSFSSPSFSAPHSSPSFSRPSVGGGGGRRR